MSEPSEPSDNHCGCTFNFQLSTFNYQVTDIERQEAIASHLHAILTLIGEDTQREGLVKTPLRAAKALDYITGGYRIDPADWLRQALFTHQGSKMVVVRDIEFYSMCEHHILPFFGHMAIGYIPDGRIVGLSKLARVVDALARRLQVQERLTAEVCRVVYDTLGAKGVIVTCRAQHLCMKMRGVEKQDSLTVTTEYLGDFATDPALRQEFMSMLD